MVVALVVVDPTGVPLAVVVVAKDYGQLEVVVAVAVVAAGHMFHEAPYEVVDQEVVIGAEVVDHQHVLERSGHPVEEFHHCVVVVVLSSYNAIPVVDHKVVDSDRVDIDRMAVVAEDVRHIAVDNKENV